MKEKVFEKLEKGIDYIAQERREQVYLHGYDAEHDDKHRNGELARAGMCYGFVSTLIGHISGPPPWWPFDIEFWKIRKGDSIDERIHELARGGAFFAAEIDRYLRMKGKEEMCKCATEEGKCKCSQEENHAAREAPDTPRIAQLIGLLGDRDSEILSLQEELAEQKEYSEHLLKVIADSNSQSAVLEGKIHLLEEMIGFLKKY